MDKWTESFKKMYDMKLGERLALTNNHMIIRVPGGWIYSSMQGEVFIPFDTEFSPFGEVKNG